MNTAEVATAIDLGSLLGGEPTLRIHRVTLTPADDDGARVMTPRDPPWYRASIADEQGYGPDVPIALEALTRALTSEVEHRADKQDREVAELRERTTKILRAARDARILAATQPSTKKKAAT